MKKVLLFLSFIVLSIALMGCSITSHSTTSTTDDITSTYDEETILNTVLAGISLPVSTEVNLELPTSYQYLGYTVNASWHSLASSIMTSTGTITRIVSDQSATLILTLSLNQKTLQKTFEVIVKGNPDYLVLYVVANSMISFDSFEITENITLPTSYEIDGKIVNAVWESANEDILSSDGVVTLGNKTQSVILSVTLSYNGVQRIETFEFTIVLDPDLLPENWWHTVSVYTNPIPNEAVKPVTPNCFPGAIYRKVVSNRDNWLGIEGTVTLPVFTPDPQRFDVTKPSYYLDNSSIYMGGNAYAESDVGLSWMIGYSSKDSTSISKSGVAFRPFWRYITSLEGCKNNNCFKNAYVKDFTTYYFPGDTIRMSVYTPKAGYLQLRIELLEETTHPDYINVRKNLYGLEEGFSKVFVTPLFPGAGMGNAPAEFKRVNAIDQNSNEGKPTLNTNATVMNAIWHEVYLYRKVSDELVKVPMTQSRTASMSCPLGSNVNGDFSQTFSISTTGVDSSLGGEVISIHPNNGTGRLYNLAILWTDEDKKRI
jgi:hypothetical protein